MARGKANDAVFQSYYAPHLNGVRNLFANNQANTEQAIIERMYMRVLTELASNRFKWEGLPPSIDARFMELTLFRYALSIFYYDEDYVNYFALQGGAAGQLNMMNNPLAFRVVGNGSFVGKTLSAVPTVQEVVTMPMGDNGRRTKNIELVRKDAECVPIWANYLRVPDLDIVMIYSKKLADIDRSIEINAHNARRTKVLVSSENQKLTNVNINRQIDEGQPFVHVKKGMGVDNDILTAVDMGVDPDSVVNLHILKVRLWGECMGLLGINNANQDKKERMVESEVSSNDAQVSAMRAVNLNARQMACDSINSLYNLNVSVDYVVEDTVTPGDPEEMASDDSDSTRDSDK
jgi:hypothetical protein